MSWLQPFLYPSLMSYPSSVCYLMQLLATVIDLQGFDYTLEYTRRSPEFFKTLQIKFHQQLPWILQELLLLKLYSPASLSVHGVAGDV